VGQPDLAEVIEALSIVEEARELEEDVYRKRVSAEKHLARSLGKDGANKDAAFDAECEAKDLIVKAAISGRLKAADEGEQAGRSEGIEVQLGSYERFSTSELRDMVERASKGDGPRLQQSGILLVLVQRLDDLEKRLAA
jgi:hypothetical protein